MGLSAVGLRAARMIYRHTASSSLRRFYYQAFARIVRDRRLRRQIDGAELELDLGETIDLTLFLGEFEKDVRAAIKRFTRPGMTVLDIGANIGAHALLFAPLVGSAGRVIAFEPTEYAFNKLVRNASLNPSLNVTPVHLALAESTESGRRIAFRSSWPTKGPRRDGECTVDFETLDSWCSRNAIEKVDLIKMDVDGNEYGVLAGSEAVLTRARPLLLMEVVGPHLDNEHRNPLRVLERHGYSFRKLTDDAPLTIEQMRGMLPEGDVGMTRSMNIIAEAKGTK